ncbi:Sodium/potassium-transporting ATPase subunit alpha [Seminavis robusta]|uniref:P-type sodium-transporting ATPase4 n=1 Tax=Seminavis robusta TaxID=568900 RepID=A0A9N8EM51_9STRA|nr:Sodium/potassium-transporting ATPase subunit alpha [Seminavis robusta]|eukprot:Sro1441_g272970.1 Sodium/potassium-transporting ATPase subunit alpha (1019) ;mRNA; f:21192-24423
MKLSVNTTSNDATTTSKAGTINTTSNDAASPGNGLPWHATSLEEILEALGCDKSGGHWGHGLSAEEAKRRLDRFGPNQLSEKEKTSLLKKIWHHLSNVLVGILAFVAVVSAIRAATSNDKDVVLTNWIQVGLIIFVVTVNTTIGIVQEGSAEQAAEALKAMLSSEAVVVRDGKDVKVPAQEIVPGDIVKLSVGDRVPADLRMIQVNNLACGEAALTGEVVPVDKKIDTIIVQTDPFQVPLGDRNNMCFSATLVSQGSGTGVIVGTGDRTEIGKINSLVSQVEKKKTNVLEQIDRVSTWLAGFILCTGTVTFFVAWKRSGLPPMEAFATSLVCCVAMIPEGLEAIVTMSYGWAVSIMAGKNAIIKALPAVETLGSVTVICSDKTGTLTQNKMSLTAFVTSGQRYRVNVNSTTRSPSNFIQDDNYLVVRGGSQNEGGACSDLPSDAQGGADVPDASFLRKALAGGILCSKCVLGENGGRNGEIGNPTELAIIRAAYMGDVNVSDVKNGAPVAAELPFSSEYKFMATVHPSNEANDGTDNLGSLVVHVKGAPDRMVNLCKYQARNGKLGDNDLEPIDIEFWMEQISILSSHGLRVLALCRGSLPEGSVSDGQQLDPEFVLEKGQWLTMVGLCGILDPPRPECALAVSEAHGAGVRIAMITGDHKDTALAIGAQLGLVDKEHSEAITGPELDSMNDEELGVAVQKYNVFARASPQNKIRIVKALQAQGEVCGMTGDGVNDAPALKAADMGVAMGKEGTDVAREASDMILADDNFATIVTAVREGRVVWDNLRKVLLVNTPINNAQGLTVLFGLIFGLPDAILSSIQVLYCNLICAVTLGFVCAVEPAEHGIMGLPPRRLGKRLIGRFLFLRIVLATTTLVATTVGSVFLIRDLSTAYTPEQQRAQALNTLAFGAVAITLSARFAYNSSFHPRIFRGNKLCWISVAIVVGLQVVITHTPGLNKTIFEMEGMDGIQWAIVVGFMFVTLSVMEIEKAVRRYLSSLGEDTDDREYGLFDEVPADNT